jgi:hypothetical protein
MFTARQNSGETCRKSATKQSRGTAPQTYRTTNAEVVKPSAELLVDEGEGDTLDRTVALLTIVR